MKNKCLWSPQVECVPLASLLSDGDLSMDSFAHLSKGMQQRVVATTNNIMSSGEDPFEHEGGAEEQDDE